MGVAPVCLRNAAVNELVLLKPNIMPISVTETARFASSSVAYSMSCCGEADAFEADSFEVSGDEYVAIITNGKGVIPEGTRIPVPNQKMKWDEGNPTGHGIIFIGSNGQVFCYVTPGGV